MVKKLLKLLKNNNLLILICFLFLATRLFRISEIPGSVYWDEASIGYNAFSVLTTGKDEWGETLPLHFRAFGEFKLPVYIYSVLVTESAFGVNAFSVRLPSVLYGLLAVLGLYLLILEISKNKTIALLSAFLFTIAPWFFIFSRTGYEATAGLTFFIWAIYLFLKFKNSSWKVLSSVFTLLLSAYSYNSFRILVPIVFLFIFGHLFLNKNFKILIISLVLVILSALPIYKLYKQDSGLNRLQTVGETQNFAVNYIKNLSPPFLFVTGDINPRSQMPGHGQLYIPDAVFVLLGIIFIYKNKKFIYLIPLIGIILAPIPAAITKESPHALRSILLAPTFAVLSAFGIYFLVTHFKNYKNYFLGAIIVLYALSFENYFYKFGTEYNSLSASAWQWEYKQVFETQKEGCVSDQYAQPYIFALFYQKIDPEVFLETKELNDVSDWGFSTVKSFGNYTFPKSCKSF